MIDSVDAFRRIEAFLRDTPVRQEQSGHRDLEFSQWLRRYCRPSKTGCKLHGIELGGFVVFDLDFILWDYNRRLLQLLEVKTHNGKVRWSQEKMLQMLDVVIKSGAPLNRITYLGLHVLGMTEDEPWASKRIVWDGIEITSEECWRRVNMLDALT